MITPFNLLELTKSFAENITGSFAKVFIEWRNSSHFLNTKYKRKVTNNIMEQLTEKRIRNFLTICTDFQNHFV